MTFSGIPFGSAASEDLRAPLGDADFQARIAAGLAAIRDDPAPDALPTLPDPATAEAEAEAWLAGHFTPARLAAVMDAVAAGDDVAMMDYLGMGVLVHRATTDPTATAALELVTAALEVRATPGLPVTDMVALPELDGSDLALPSPFSQAARFGDGEVLGMAGRVQRVDEIDARHLDILDQETIRTTVEYSSAQDVFRNYYYYSYSSFYFAYAYSYDLYERNTESHYQYERMTESIYQLLQTFDLWRMTAGVNVALLAQTADLPDTAAAHSVYLLTTPYAYIDHWWSIYALEQYFFSLYFQDAHSFSSYWSVSTSDFSASGSDSSSFSNSYGVTFGFETEFADAGHERTPIFDLALVASPVLRFDLPLGELQPLPRREELVNLGTAATVALPGQVGVEYKDEKFSEKFFTSPDVSDAALVVTPNPLTNAALTRADDVAAALGDAVADAAGANPEALLMALADDIAATGAALLVDPTQLAPCVPNVGGPSDCPPPAAPDVPDVALEADGRQAWLRITFAADFLRSGRGGGAGVGVLALQDAFPDGRDMIVSLSGAGLGADFIFSIDVDGANLVVEGPDEPDVPEVPEAPELPDPPAFTVGDPKSAVLLMPGDVSYPAYLESLGLGEADLDAVAKAALLDRMTPARLRATMDAMQTAGTPQGAVSLADATGVSVIGYYAGPGYAEDPAFGDIARARLVVAFAPEAEAHGTAPCVDDPTVPEDPTTAPPPDVPAPEAAAACAENTANGAASDAGDAFAAAAQVALTDNVHAEFDGAILAHDIQHNTGKVVVDYFDWFTQTSSSSSRVHEIYEIVRVTDYWGYYVDRTYSRSDVTTGGASQYDSVTEFFLRNVWDYEFHYFDGVVTASLAYGGSTDPGDVAGAQLFQLVLPFTFPSEWEEQFLHNGYVFDFLAAHPEWQAFYMTHVATAERPAAPPEEGGIYVTTPFTGLDGSQQILGHGGFVATGGKIAFNVPMSTYTLLADTGTPFITGGGGFMPFQDATDRTGAFMADTFVMGPVPNAVNVRVDEDPTVDKPLTKVGEMEAALVVAESDARNLADVLTHDPAGFAEATVAPFRGPVDDAEAMVMDVLMDPEGFVARTADDAASEVPEAPEADPDQTLADAMQAATDSLNAVYDELEALYGAPNDPLGYAGRHLTFAPAVALPDLPAVAPPPAPTGPADPVGDALGLATAGLLAVYDELNALYGAPSDPEGYVNHVVSRAGDPPEVPGGPEMPDVPEVPEVPDPVALARDATDADDTTVDVPTHDVPKDVDEDAYYEVIFTSAGFAPGQPVLTYVGVMVPKDKGTVDQRDIVVTVTGAGLVGGDALGAVGPFLITHTADLRGDDLLPDSVGGGTLAPGDELPSSTPEVV